MQTIIRVYLKYINTRVNNNNITFLAVYKKWLYQLMFPILGKPKKYNLWLRKQSKYIKYNLLGRHLQEKG